MWITAKTVTAVLPPLTQFILKYNMCGPFCIVLSKTTDIFYHKKTIFLSKIFDYLDFRYCVQYDTGAIVFKGIVGERIRSKYGSEFTNKYLSWKLVGQFQFFSPKYTKWICSMTELFIYKLFSFSKQQLKWKQQKQTKKTRKTNLVTENFIICT